MEHGETDQRMNILHMVNIFIITPINQQTSPSSVPPWGEILYGWKENPLSFI